MRRAVCVLVVSVLAGCGAASPTVPSPAPSPSAIPASATPNTAATATRGVELTQIATQQAQQVQIATLTALLAVPPATPSPIPRPTAIPTPIPSATATVIVHPKIGQRVVDGSLAITVHGVRDPVAPGSYLPKPGTRLVAVDFTYENVGRKTQDYNINDVSMSTTDDRTFRYFYSDVPIPPYLYGNARPGERVRGWAVFDIPFGATMATFHYMDLDGDAITVDLR